jgi:hypothetical protein
MTNLDGTEEQERATRRPTAELRWLPDNPFAAVGMWAVLLGLVCVDVALLKPMVAAATNEQHGWLTWILTVGIGIGLALTMWVAAECLMRYVERRTVAWALAAATFVLAWLGAVVFSFFFRMKYHAASGSGSNAGPIGLGQASGGSSGQSTGSGNELYLAILLTLLVVLTGLIAAGLTVLTHDDLQKQRRTCARRQLRLRFQRRLATYAENRHDTAAGDRQLELDDIGRRAEQQGKKLPSVADSLKQEVRLRMATAFGDPGATTALTHGPGFHTWEGELR